MDRRGFPRRRARGGEGIPPTRATLTALTLGIVSVALAAGLVAWLALDAGPDASRAVAGTGAAAVAGLLATLAAGRPEPIAGVLAVLGGAYAAFLAIDNPPLDARAAIVGAALLAIGELAHLSVEAREAVAGEPGTTARRVGWVAVLAITALGLGAALLAVVDVLRAGGIAVEAIGTAAAAAAVGLLVLAARDARSGGS